MRCGTHIPASNARAAVVRMAFQKIADGVLSIGAGTPAFPWRGVRATCALDQSARVGRSPARGAAVAPVCPTKCPVKWLEWDAYRQPGAIHTDAEFWWSCAPFMLFLRWEVEKRTSLFEVSLGTARPPSPPTINQVWIDLRRRPFGTLCLGSFSVSARANRPQT